MARLSFVVTSEIKYTEQYCYNKEKKNTSCQFYLITKIQQLYKSIQLHGKGTCISNNISINIIYIFSSRFTVQNSNGRAPNKHPPS